MNPGFRDGGEGNGAQLRSASYRLPALDQDSWLGDSMRGVRFLLEYGKAEEALRSWAIRSTIVVFGSARVREDGPEPQSRWYREARAFGRIVSERGGALSLDGRLRDNVIATGGARFDRGGEPRPPRGRSSVDRLQHRALGRAGTKPFSDAGTHLPIPLLRDAQDASRDARERAGRVSGRVRHPRRAIRDPHPETNREGAANPDPASARRLLERRDQFRAVWGSSAW